MYVIPKSDKSQNKHIKIWINIAELTPKDSTNYASTKEFMN